MQLTRNTESRHNSTATVTLGYGSIVGFASFFEERQVVRSAALEHVGLTHSIPCTRFPQTSRPSAALRQATATKPTVFADDFNSPTPSTPPSYLTINLSGKLAWSDTSSPWRFPLLLCFSPSHCGTGVSTMRSKPQVACEGPELA